VTFRYYSPKAITVQVSGDFFPTERVTLDCEDKGYPVTFYESEGGHIWRNWRLYLNTFAPLLFK